MLFYLMIAAGTVALALLVRTMPLQAGSEYGKAGISRQQACNGLCLLSIFVILFAVSACRLNVGNDYAKYVEFMHLIACDAYDYVPTEVGFNVLVTVLYELAGAENFLLVFAVFAFFTLWLF